MLFTVSKPIKTSVEIRYRTAQQRLQVMVMLCGRVIVRKIRNSGLKLSNGAVMELKAVVDSSAFKGVEVLELPPNAAAVRG